MTSIYKKQPNVHQLPTGWDDMDAVKFSNINSIRGLQHVDNSLAADQNATYNCKNVYQDESNNLTIRPALRFKTKISEQYEVLGIYHTTLGELYHIYNGTDYVLQNNDGLYSIIGEGRIAVQESDGNVYILYTAMSGKLQFRQWDGNQLIDFEPDILLNNPSDFIESRFNLLTDKYVSNIPTVSIKPTLDMTWDSFNLEYKAIWDIPDNIEYKVFIKDTMYIVTRSALYIIGDSISVLDISKLDIYFDTWYMNIWEDSDIVYFSVILSNNNTISTYIISRTSLILDSEYDAEYPIVAVLTHNKYLGSIVTTTAANSSRRYIVVDGITGNILYTQEYTYSRYIELDSGALVDSYGFNIGPSIAGSTIWFLNNPRLQTENVIYDTLTFEYYDYITGKFATRAIPISTRNFSYNEYISLALPSEGGYIINAYSDADHVQLESSIYYPMRSHDDYTMTSSNKISYRDFYCSTNDATLTANDGFYVYKDGKYTKVDMRGYSIGGVFNDGATLVVKSDHWYFINRTITNKLLEMFRPVSENFPVLSNIEDEVLTSFYLDNIYWFVTKHRVFGTGVANEQFSIKYFDPRKYFHFDEELTGAIRISDSSFWVLHNKGAYLIYKSTSDLYDETIGEYVTVITWLSTATAESKGCDFDNAVMTLPVSSYVASVTTDDISYIQMRENVQTDDRILVPMTLGIRKFVSGLLNETETVVTGAFKYNALFFLNPANDRGIVPVLVYNTTTESWWYWELPVNKVLQAKITETNLEILAQVGSAYNIYDFYTEYYNYTIGGLTYELYADRICSNEPTQIEWFWESSILHFNTIDYKKQLLFTNFTFGERESSTISFEYNFEVYDQEYSDRSWSDITQVVERVKTYSCKNIISKFMYLQLYLRNIDAEELDFNAYTRPKFSAISFKYRILPGGLL